MKVPKKKCWRWKFMDPCSKKILMAKASLAGFYLDFFIIYLFCLNRLYAANSIMLKDFLKMF